MSRHKGRHAKVSPGRKGRHARPVTPSPAAAVIGTAAKAVPASIVLGAAGSALALSGPASAATAAPAAGGAPAKAAAVAAASTPRFVTQVRNAARASSYTVISGDTLSGISARLCGTSADYSSLAAASGLSDPNQIRAGQHIAVACHAAARTLAAASSSGDNDGDSDDGAAQPASGSSSGSGAVRHAPVQQAQVTSAGNVSTGGMSAFEACVISHESGGNPQAVNASSGAGGLFQFLPSTWASLGYASAYPGGAQTAPVSVQEAAFAKLYAQAGTAPWGPYDGC